MNGFSQVYLKKNYIPRGKCGKIRQIAPLFLILSLMSTINLVYKLDLYPRRNVLEVPFESIFTF